MHILHTVVPQLHGSDMGSNNTLQQIKQNNPSLSLISPKKFSFLRRHFCFVLFLYVGVIYDEAWPPQTKISLIGLSAGLRTEPLLENFVFFCISAFSCKIEIRTFMIVSDQQSFFELFCILAYR